MLATPSKTAELAPSAESLCAERLLGRLETTFQQTFAVVDASRGVLERVTADWPRVDVFRWLALCEQVARRGTVEVLEDHSPLLLIAVPLDSEPLGAVRVAVTVLLTCDNATPEAIGSAARVFGVDHETLAAWAMGRRAWPAHAAAPLASALLEAEQARETIATTKSQVSDVSAQLLATFEELNLLHQLTEGLSLGRSDKDLTEQALHSLAAIVPSDCIVVQTPGTHSALVAGRESPIANDRLDDFFERLGPQAERRTIVLNRDRTSSPTWAYPEVREVVSSPIVSNDTIIGWLAAFNFRPKHGTDETGFGSVEASLLSSVATLIGVHSGNRRLFKEHTELFDSAVRALTSAIDAKDPYTCGHSDRVARIAVRLAKQLGCSETELNTLYLGGLLHDIGKIGVDDVVLRKPGKLTDEEYDQIKTHPNLGERILRSVPQMGHVLPIVLHHHEAWDGGGYPGGLVGEETPLLARITAVADSIDAMGSDRPYRKGMPFERIEDILRDGAGKQWDRRVVDAYFAIREEIQALERIDREPLDLDVARWQTGEACPIENQPIGNV